MGMRKADTKKTKRYEKDGEWIELRTELTIGERNMLQEQSQTFVGGLDGAVESRNKRSAFQRMVFRIIAVDWSGEHADGKPSVDAYESLDEEWGDWIEECMDDSLSARREALESGKDEPKELESMPESSPSEEAASSETPTTTES